LADNSLHKNLLVGGFEGPSEEIVDKPKSFADVMNNLGIRLKDETLKQITSGNAIQGRSESLTVSGDLEQGFRFHWDVFGNTVVGEVFMVDYYDHINKGISGSETIRDTPYSWDNVKFPAMQKLTEWADARNLSDFLSPIRKSMIKKGVLGRGYFDRVIENTEKGEIHNLLIQDLKSAGQLGLLKNIKKQMEGKK
tara:strand:+ start:674 stop:1258 length:585 start_codon:yes stop_codon:yes gene_type:complete